MSTSEQASPAFKDDDIVYVDPDSKTVVGKLEWAANGERPKSMPYKPIVAEKADGAAPKKDRPFFRKFFPYGTYRSMKRIYKIEGKVKDPEPNKTLEEVLPKALSEAFWSW